MKYLIIVFVFLISVPILAQCEIHNKVQADGSMMYFIEPAVFYTTESKSLKIGVVTDKESYFIALQPFPFPAKEIGKKIKDDLIIKLSDNNKYKLRHYDTRYIKHDSVMHVLYMVDKKDLKEFASFEAISAEINMKGTEFIRSYAFKLHKKAIMEQLNCFLKEQE